MRKAALAGAFALVSAAACDSVLDIETPRPRPTEDAEAGQPAAAGSPHGGSAPDVDGGAGGQPPTTPDPVAGGESGQGGEPPQRVCEPDAVRCDGKSPQICDRTGQWTPNTDEAAGECAFLCERGKCAECEEGARRCSICLESDINCSQKLPQTCVDGAWKNTATACKHYCDDGECMIPPSCEAQHEARTTCANGESCCSSLLVPGGSFSRDFDAIEATDDSYKAEVRPFFLDKFEVTVGRMRQFVFAYDEIKKKLKDGSGKSSYVAGDAGWSSDYELPADKADLISQLTCNGGGTWSDQDLDNNLPISCVSFNIAYAFCIWDKGRLPTEAEWNFAAAGGAEQRTYPWKTQAGDSITTDYANYDSTAAIAVGSKPLGNGRWGHSDLAGNLFEWTLDYFGDYPRTCVNCLNTTSGTERAVRSGPFIFPADGMFVWIRSSLDPNVTRPFAGVRCAHEKKL